MSLLPKQKQTESTAIHWKEISHHEALLQKSFKRGGFKKKTSVMMRLRRARRTIKRVAKSIRLNDGILRRGPCAAEEDPFLNYLFSYVGKKKKKIKK